MVNYKIYCTEEQTKKAILLGAQIEYAKTRHDLYNNRYCFVDGIEPSIIIPTAEQMIGWLEEQDVIEEIEVSIWEGDKWAQIVHLKNSPAIVTHTLYNSRKEATIASIDAALDYLINNKK